MDKMNMAVGIVLESVNYDMPELVTRLGWSRVDERDGRL